MTYGSNEEMLRYDLGLLQRDQISSLWYNQGEITGNCQHSKEADIEPWDEIHKLS